MQYGSKKESLRFDEILKTVLSVNIDGYKPSEALATVEYTIELLMNECYPQKTERTIDEIENYI